MNSAQDDKTAQQSNEAAKTLYHRLATVRARSLELSTPLSAEDQCIQSMPDTSPTKWHLAHTTWFFETFVLLPAHAGYTVFHKDFNYLFNSYYEQIGPRHARPSRGLLSRPALAEVLAYRRHVDDALAELASTPGGIAKKFVTLLELGLNHEQQHQELLLTDIKHVFSCNLMKPAYQPPSPRDAARTRAQDWVDHPGGLVKIGYDGGGFAFDCEGPRHNVWLDPFRLATRAVTNGEYLEFMRDGGYTRPEFWLSDGWSISQAQGWTAPSYWQKGDDDSWSVFTLSGLRPKDPDSPVCHVSYFEADAYARWAGHRLPSESEWEAVAAGLEVDGHFVDTRAFHPLPANGDGMTQIFGDVWEWTKTAYGAYPGFKPDIGAVGEYNVKVMSGQMVLRGGSCATPEDHIRASYRNFFYPKDRWQFSGIRLASDDAQRPESKHGI
ncbi:MAG: ergothioneine biosynthesis protein EgtB [Rhodospirillaceae bacterium]|nr:ergothioneine biosynthesis protein EgtB [Rhodospirillaceae bacterium]